MAETPKAPDPARFKKVIHHGICDGRQAKEPWHSSAQASQLATRKQTEPSASGRQIWWCVPDAPSPTTKAAKVVRLNHSVPASWMRLAHQSIRRCCTVKSERKPRRDVPSTADA